jgi:hypothetical protein
MIIFHIGLLWIDEICLSEGKMHFFDNIFIKNYWFRLNQKKKKSEKPSLTIVEEGS